MTNEQIFANRVRNIERSAGSVKRARTPSSRSLGERLLTPLMLTCCLAGGITAVWEGMDRPTDTPLTFAGNLTSQLISYIGTI